MNHYLRAIFLDSGDTIVDEGTEIKDDLRSNAQRRRYNERD